MCSILPVGGATDDVVRALTATVRALPASGRGLVAAVEAEARLELVDADGVCQDDATLTAAAWLRRRSRSSPEAARRTVTLARRLHTDPERPLPVAGAALAAGDLTSAQVQAVADVTAGAPAAAVTPLEETLVARAAHLGADELRRVGRDLVDRLAAAQADTPDRREREHGSCYLRTHDTIFGRIAVEGILSAEVGSLLRAVLDPLATPVASTDSDGTRTRDPRTMGERLHDALGEVLAIAAASEATPGQGGSAPHLQVLVDADTLLGAAARCGDGTGLVVGPLARTLDGLPLTLPQLAGIGCDARVSWLAVRDGASPADLPAVAGIDPDALRRALRHISPALGGIPMEVLAAGRATRLVTPAQRRALDARVRGCVVPGCHAPPRRCQAHHVRHWIDGGPTDLTNLALVCVAHHRFLHERNWTLRRAPEGHAWLIHPPPDTRLAAA